MRITRNMRLLTALLATMLPTLASAESATNTCLSGEEAEGLITYALPGIVRTLSHHCAKSLPATAPLVQSGLITAARYQIDADKAWPVASVAFDKISGLPVAHLVGETAIKPLIEHSLTDAVAQYIKAKDCVTVDRLINILQPLPTRNMAMLIAALLEAGNSPIRASVPIKLCPADTLTPVTSAAIGQ